MARRRQGTSGDEAPVQAVPEQKHSKLDLWHKGLYPALYLATAILFGSISIYFNLAKVSAENEVERLRAAVSQHAEQEQRAKDQAQLLREGVIKEYYREKKLSEKGLATNSVNIPHLLSLGFLHGTIQRSEEEKFGKEVKELWDKAEKKAAEEAEKPNFLDY